jgi:hypothetical protein
VNPFLLTYTLILALFVGLPADRDRAGGVDALIRWFAGSFPVPLSNLEKP